MKKTFHTDPIESLNLSIVDNRCDHFFRCMSDSGSLIKRTPQKSILKSQISELGYVNMYQLTFDSFITFILFAFPFYTLITYYIFTVMVLIRSYL